MEIKIIIKQGGRTFTESPVTFHKDQRRISSGLDAAIRIKLHKQRDYRPIHPPSTTRISPCT